MKAVDFPESNVQYGPPPDMTEAQCSTIYAFRGEAKGGSCDGAPIVVVAWQPTGVDMARIMAGGPVFLTVVGSLPPHLLATSFEEAIGPK